MGRYLEITDGVTSFRLDGNSETDFFAVRGKQWTPAIARRRNKTVAGVLFEDVEENIPLIIKSTADEATVLDNIETLNGLIEQAGRWYLGEAVNPVIFRFSPISGSSYLECAVLGPPRGKPAISLPNSFEEFLGVRRVIGVTLSFVRRGQWLADEVYRAVSKEQGVVGSVTFPTKPKSPSPTRIVVTPMVCLGMNPSFSKEGYLLFGNKSDDIEVIDLGGTTPQFSGESCLGGEYKSIGVGTSTGSFSVNANGNTSARRVAVFATLSTTSEILIRFGCYTDSVGGNKYAPWKAIPSTNPLPVFLGTIAFPDGNIQNIKLQYKTKSGSSTLSIDYLCLFNVANSSNVALRYLFDQSRTDALEIDHALLERPVPLVEVGSGYYPGYQGRAVILSEETKFYCIHLGTDMSGGWRDLCGDGGDFWPLTFQIGMYRRLGYLVPQ